MKVLGFEIAKKYKDEGILDIWGEFTNERKAHCKICGEEIRKGEGIGAYFWAMQLNSDKHWLKCRHRLQPDSSASCVCDIRDQHVFVCKSCDDKLDEKSSSGTDKHLVASQEFEEFSRRASQNGRVG